MSDEDEEKEEDEETGDEEDEIDEVALSLWGRSSIGMGAQGFCGVAMRKGCWPRAICSGLQPEQRLFLLQFSTACAVGV